MSLQRRRRRDVINQSRVRERVQRKRLKPSPALPWSFWQIRPLADWWPLRVETVLDQREAHRLHFAKDYWPTALLLCFENKSSPDCCTASRLTSEQARGIWLCPAKCFVQLGKLHSNICIMLPPPTSQHTYLSHIDDVAKGRGDIPGLALAVASLPRTKGCESPSSRVLHSKATCRTAWKHADV